MTHARRIACACSEETNSLARGRLLLRVCSLACSPIPKLGTCSTETSGYLRITKIYFREDRSVQGETYNREIENAVNSICCSIFLYKVNIYKYTFSWKDYLRLRSHHYLPLNMICLQSWDGHARWQYLWVLLARVHTEETGNSNAAVISEKKSPISTRQLVSTLAGTHWGNLCLISCSRHLKCVRSSDLMRDCNFIFVHFSSAMADNSTDPVIIWRWLRRREKRGRRP
jgi:hypothetical protein